MTGLAGASAVVLTVVGTRYAIKRRRMLAPPSITLPEGEVLDEPIHGSAEDRLDRSNYARVVSDEIAAIPAGSSTVLAVTGSWGTGKTSFMNLVFEQLKQDRGRD